MLVNRTLRRRSILKLSAAVVSIPALTIPTSALGADTAWNGSANTSWSNPANWSLNEPGAADIAIFPGTIPATGSLITLDAGELANVLRFESSYTLNGGTLALTTGGGGVRVNLAETATINSQLTGAAGLTKSGGGAAVLGNAANSFTGTITISNGSLIINSASALGASTSPIVVTGSQTRGFGGGSLVLNGGINLTRDLSLQGRGPVTDRSAALLSYGDNTLSGVVNAANGNVNTTLASVGGRLTIANTLNVPGTAGTTFTILGITNGGGVGSYEIAGPLSGTGTLEKASSGTLILNPSVATGFSGRLRVSGGTVLVTSVAALGTATSTGTSAPIDMNGGTLELRLDAPAIGKEVYHRAGGGAIFIDHAIGSTALNGTATFGNFSFEDNLTSTFSGRNGYGMTFGTAAVQGGDNNSTITNNLNGLLTFTGAFWSNTNDTANRTMTIGGNGDTLIGGNLTASSAAFNHSLTKSGTGTLTISSTGSTLDGSVNIQNGTLAIADFRSINNNASTINLGSTTTSGVLSVIGNNLAAADVTTSKSINLAGTTGGGTILANQTGTSPGLVLNANITATTGAVGEAKTLTLGGANTADNRINGVIPNNAAGGTVNLTKVDAGTWVLAGNNTYSGATTITNGTLKLQATAGASDLIKEAASNTIVFNAGATQSAGGVLQFTGLSGAATTETLGALTTTAGMGTVRLTSGGSGAAANLVFTSAAAPGKAGGLNFDIAGAGGGTVTLNGVATTTATTLPGNGHFYVNGADFARSNGGVIVTPVYDTDAGFVTAAAGSATLTAASHNFVTGDIADQTAVSVTSLKMTTHSLGLVGDLTVNTGAATNDGGILVTGGTTASITGGGLTTGGTGTLVYRVDGAGDVLTLNTPMLASTTGGFTKNGEGTLILSGNNLQTGTTTINQGTVRLTTGARLSGANADLALRQGATLDLNGVSSGTAIRALNGAGTITNGASAATTTLTVGNGDGGGTFSGLITNGTGGGVLNVTKVGTGSPTWSGINTYSGVTTIGSTGVITVTSLTNIGSPSGIGTGNAASNAASLVFNGASSSQSFGGLSYAGRESISIDRLFTFGGNAANSGARIQANGVNNATMVWNNPAPLVFEVANVAKGLVLGGASTGDNQFNPQITNNGTAAVSLYKSDGGLWILGNAGNSYTGVTQINAGALRATDGSTMPSASNLVLNGGVLESSGAFNRTYGTGGSNVRWFNGGFSAADSKLTVNLGPATPVWNSSANFVLGSMTLSSSTARAEVELASGFEITPGTASAFNATTTAGSSTVTLTSGTTAGLAIGQTITGNANIPAGRTIASIISSTQFTLNSGTSVVAGTSIATTANAGGYRLITVNDNGNTALDYATISGSISGTGVLRKAGSGTLQLFGSNTYAGATEVVAGTLAVRSLGNSGTSGVATSVGTSTGANTNGVFLGDFGTGAATLQYLGAGETSDRLIQLNSTGSNQIHADGTGPMVLSNVQNSAIAGAKTLLLRGSNTQANMITNQLSDNGGALTVQNDGGGTWVLTASNNYTGSTNNSAGALGAGHDNAFGAGTLAFNNGSLFAYGADRTIANPVTHANNTSQAFIGDYSLNLTSTYVSLAGANNFTITNGIAAGKTLTLGNMTANSITAARSMTINGTGDTIINGSITTSTAFDLPLIYSGTGSLTLAGSGHDINNGSVSVNSGTLKFGATAPDFPGSLNFGSANNVTTAGTLDLSNVSATFGALVAQTNTTAYSNLIIGPARTLTINGNVTIGSSSGALTNTRLLASGGGVLNVASNAAAATFGVGGYSGTTSGQGNIAIADLSGLSSVTVNYSAADSLIRVNNPSGTNSNNPAATLLLPTTGAATTTLTANELAVGSGGQYNGVLGQVNRLVLGSGVNTININTLNIGTGGRDLGSITFANAEGSLVIQTPANPLTGRVAFNMGTGGATTAVALPAGNANTFDVRGHNANLRFAAMTIGTQNRNALLQNDFYFNQGQLDASSLTMSTRGANTQTTNSLFDIGGGVVGIGTGSGTAITLATSNTVGATANATINLTGGTMTLRGNIVRGGGGGTTNATVSVDGGTLDMGGFNLGGATAGTSINNLVLAAGSLGNVGQINNGDPINKTTPGTLTIFGTNTWSGALNVSAGVLLANGSIASAVQVTNNAATVGGNGTISGPLTVTAGTLSPGTSVGTLSAGSLTLAAGSQFLAELSADGVGDKVNVAGDTTGGNAHLQISLLGGYGPQNATFILIDNAGAAPTPALFKDVQLVSGGPGPQAPVDFVLQGGSIWSATDAGGNQFTIDYAAGATANDVRLTVSAVPEPAALGLLAMTGVGLLGRRRRR